MNSHAWEEMLLEKKTIDGAGLPNSVGQGAPPVHEIERMARHHVKAVLERAKEHCWGCADKERLGFLSQFSGVDVISLNFDAFWAESLSRPKNWPTKKSLGKVPLGEEAHDRLYFFHESGGRKIWYANGRLDKPQTIRLGIRDFGLHAQELYEAFRLFKQWERKFRRTGDDKSEVITDEEFEQIAGELKQLDRGPPANWVTHFMLRPVFILGAELSAEEQGIWWLICQRARNTARVGTSSPIRILRNLVLDATNQKALWWMTKPYGIEPIWAHERDWNDGWNQAGKLIRECIALPQ